MEKKVGPRHYSQARLDVLFGSISCMVIVFFIIVCTAATLNRTGLTNITDAAEAAKALVPLAGKWASYLFAFGLLNASIFSATILPLSTAHVICEGMGFEAGLDRGCAALRLQRQQIRHPLAFAGPFPRLDARHPNPLDAEMVRQLDDFAVLGRAPSLKPNGDEAAASPRRGGSRRRPRPRPVTRPCQAPAMCIKRLPTAGPRQTLRRPR